MSHRLLITAILLTLLSSCSVVEKVKGTLAESGSSNTNTEADITSEAVATTTTPDGTRVPAPIVFLPEFNDIPVPTELRRDDERSFVYETTGVSLGVLTYTGYFKPKSINTFYRNEMPANGWKFINAFTDSGRYYLSYIKDVRSCIISVEETTMSTKLVIKVGPTAAAQ